MTPEHVHQIFKEAIIANDVDVIVESLQRDEMDVNFRDVMHDMETPLMQLCHSCVDDTFIESHLLEAITARAPQLNLQDAVGRTLAMHACIAMRTPILHYILAHDSDVTICDRTGRNVFHYGACTGNEDIVEPLLQHLMAKSALKVLDLKGYSPLDLARQQKVQAVVRRISQTLNNNPQNSAPTTVNRPLKPFFRSTGAGLQRRADPLPGQGTQLGRIKGKFRDSPSSSLDDYSNFPLVEGDDNDGGDAYRENTNPEKYQADYGSQLPTEVISPEKYAPHDSVKSHNRLEKNNGNHFRPQTFSESPQPQPRSEYDDDDTDTQDVSSSDSVDSSSQPNSSLSNVPQAANGIQKSKPNSNLTSDVNATTDFDTQNTTTHPSRREPLKNVYARKRVYKGSAVNPLQQKEHSKNDASHKSIPAPKPLPPVSWSRRKISLHVQVPGGSSNSSSAGTPSPRLDYSKPRQRIMDAKESQNSQSNRLIMNAFNASNDNNSTLTDANTNTNSNPKTNIHSTANTALSRQAMAIPFKSDKKSSGKTSKCNGTNSQGSGNLNALLSPLHHHNRLLQRRRIEEGEESRVGAASRRENDAGGEPTNTDDGDSLFEEEISLDSNLSPSGSSTFSNNNQSRLKGRRSSLSLPDLRDMTGFLVTSQTNSPSSDTSKMADAHHWTNASCDFKDKSPMHYFSDDEYDDDDDEKEDDDSTSDDGCIEDGFAGGDSLDNYTDLFKPKGPEENRPKGSGKPLPTIKVSTPRQAKPFLTPRQGKANRAKMFGKSEGK